MVVVLIVDLCLCLLPVFCLFCFLGLVYLLLTKLCYWITVAFVFLGAVVYAIVIMCMIISLWYCALLYGFLRVDCLCRIGIKVGLFFCSGDFSWFWVLFDVIFIRFVFAGFAWIVVFMITKLSCDLVVCVDCDFLRGVWYVSLLGATFGLVNSCRL